MGLSSSDAISKDQTDIVPFPVIWLSQHSNFSNVLSVNIF